MNKTNNIKLKSSLKTCHQYVKEKEANLLSL